MNQTRSNQKNEYTEEQMSKLGSHERSIMNSNHKILLLEDEPCLQELYKKTLEEEGYQVTVAKNAKKALQLFKREMPEVLLCDVFRPSQDIFQILNRMKAIEKSVHIVAITEPEFSYCWSESQLIDEAINKTGDLSYLKETLLEHLMKHEPAPTPLIEHPELIDPRRNNDSLPA